MTILRYFDLINFRRVSLLLLSAGIFILTAGYNVYWDGSKYHTGYYLFFLIAGLVYVFTDLKTSAKIIKEPLAIVAVIFFITIAVSQLYPGIDARPASELEKGFMILLSLLVIGQYVSGNAALFCKVVMVGVVAVSLVAIHHLYMFYLLEGHSINDRLVGYFIPENPLYLAQSFGFFFIAAVYLAVRNRRSPLALVLMALSASILVFAVVATQSRSFVVASMVALVFLFAGSGRKTVVIVSLSVFIIFSIIFYMNPAILERTELIRPQIWRQALAIISERPFLGWGGDYYPEISIEGKRVVLLDSHNILLTIWLKYGALSVATLMALFCYAVSIVLGNTGNATLRFGGALLTFGITMLFFEGHNIITKPNSTWHMVWIPLGIIIGALHERQHGSGSAAA